MLIQLELLLCLFSSSNLEIHKGGSIYDLSSLTSGFLLENITRGGGGKTQHRESLRGRLNNVRQHTI